MFSIFKDTIFENSPTKLLTWFYAIRLFLNAAKGISACQLRREIGVTYKCAWRMFHQIRIAMGNSDMKELFEGVVQADETYIGGKPRKADQLKNKRGRGTNKIPVRGIKEQKTGRVYAEIADPDENNQRLTGKQSLVFFDKTCTQGATIVTDDFLGYNILNKPTEKNFIHHTVNHSKNQYKTKEGWHTNGIESHWSRLKRAHYGTYHHMSEKYLPRYINECNFRQNNCTNKNIFDTLLTQTILVKIKLAPPSEKTMRHVSFAALECTVIETYIDYQNEYFRDNAKNYIEKSIFRRNGTQTYVIERMNNDGTFQLWGFEHDFTENDARYFLEEFDKGNIAA